jgi:hypothetical protein
MTRVITPKLESPPELFFAFPDGVYDYKCAECTALCCKGHGFGGSLDREMRSLLCAIRRSKHGVFARGIDLATAGGCVMPTR